jgi:hypothetical protein
MTKGTKTKRERAVAQDQPPQRGTAAALLYAARQCAQIVQPGDVEELERLIEEGCERPGDIRQPFAS